jgi:hypothetical protein
MADADLYSNPQYRSWRLPSAISVFFKLALVALVGVWVGMFETFGGDMWRKQTFFSLTLIGALVAGVWIARQFGLHWAFGFFLVLVARLVYGFATAFGETLYVGPSDFSDFVKTLLLALDNRL